MRAHLFAPMPVKPVIQCPPSPSPAEEQFTTPEHSEYEKDDDLEYQDIDPTQDTRVLLPLQRPTLVPPDLEGIPEDQEDLEEQEHEIETHIEAPQEQMWIISGSPETSWHTVTPEPSCPRIPPHPLQSPQWVPPPLPVRQSTRERHAPLHPDDVYRSRQPMDILRDISTCRIARRTLRLPHEGSSHNLEDSC